ncbi:caspase-8-like isoform X1 [Hypanus sabinus]|uniref:caspase-8-like isoform X1 n=2 Tax=Hypanus sabinus TaxID=79690 RepID=UPI0028C3E11F|nr:caspase-8-like isoform X1 [Hypanus sabinus]
MGTPGAREGRSGSSAYARHRGRSSPPAPGPAIRLASLVPFAQRTVSIEVFGRMESAGFRLSTCLNDISENLGSDELKAMKFLCQDLLSKNQLDKADSGLRLFQFLQERGLLQVENTLIVAELLYRTKQFWLLKKINYDKETVSKQLMHPGRSRVSSYRQLLFEVSEDITKKDLETVKHFLHQYLSKSKLESIKTMLDALVEMEKEGLLEDCNTTMLEDICKQLGDHLVEKFECYQREGRGQDEELLTPVPESNLPGPPEAHDAREATSPPGMQLADLTEPSLPMECQNSFSESPDLRQLDNYNSHNTELISDSQEVLVYYKMKSNPRGYCVIINNSTFQGMPPRKGTNQDAERLKWVFTWLGFTVKIENNLTAEAMQMKMVEYSQKDHKHFDCFVCCILTHGERGVTFGTDAKKVPIRNITACFSASQCPSLKQKPKLFFIQACQGTEKQEGVEIDGDSVAVQRLEEDAMTATRAIIPDEADFLLGMATVEGYVSFRHVQDGTWYIQSLCENLEKHCPSQDLLSILTNVNNDVSEKTDKNLKTQMPQPSYTLRKKLYFPVDQSFADFRKTSPGFHTRNGDLKD